MRPALTTEGITAGRWRERAILGLLIGLPLLLFVLSLGMGLYPIPAADVGRILLSPLAPDLVSDIPEVAQTLVLRIRLPRVLAAMVIGAVLASTGTAFQGLFRNPLVDSGLLGVTAGAGFGAALALTLRIGDAGLQVFAFAFGLLAVMMAFFGSRLYRSAPMLVLTLMGVLIGSFFASLTALLKYIADPLDTLPAITFWLLGSLTGVTWDDLPLLLFTMLAGGAFLFALRWRLNLLSLGDAEASALGVNPTRLKLGLILVATLMTASAVAVGGVIGWIGLVIPHAGRLLVGPDHLRLLPATFSMGAMFLLLVDNLSRVMLPTEVPLGVLTGLVGVPLLIVLLRRSRTGW
jgi:iron complex transport system permease protein